MPKHNLTDKGYYWIRDGVALVIAHYDPELGTNGRWHWMGVSGSDDANLKDLNVVAKCVPPPVDGLDAIEQFAETEREIARFHEYGMSKLRLTTMSDENGCATEPTPMLLRMIRDMRDGK